MLSVLLTLTIAPAAALDQRPSNTTCLARALSGGSSGGGIRAQRAFGSLSFAGPTQIRQHPVESNRFYLSERKGLIKSFDRDGSRLSTALDIRDRMRFTATNSTQSEQWGVMSFAFDPRFSQNPYIYVAYNRRPSSSSRVRSYVSRFRADSSGRSFSPSSETVLFSIEQNIPWHHVGQLQFGPDERLYVGSGDGGDRSRAQNSASLHGKILQIDVRTSPPQVRIYARGVRNPWRFSFDGSVLWFGDVGWNTWEEINRITSGGGNYGWPIYEGFSCLGGNCGTAGLTRPLHTFGHSVGSAVIGGYVYRGSRMPALAGHYIFGAGSGPRLMALVPSGYTSRIEIGQLPQGRATGFFRDRDGELFVVDTVGNAVWELFSGRSEGGEPAPELLSNTGCVLEQDPKRFASGVIPFDVNQPLWSDGTDKSRGFALPNGARIGVAADGDFQLPVGSVTIKSFRLDGATIETRLMMNHPDGGGWRGYSYEWTGSDGRLVPSTGKTKAFNRPGKPTLTWLYPSRGQCAQCHTQAAGVSLSLETAQLNRNFTYPNGRTLNQIEAMKRIGLFDRALPSAGDLPALATRTSGTVTQRARAYLHANCAHCHRPNGGGRVDADLRYTQSAREMNVCWETPMTESFGIAGAHVLTPGDPSRSMIAVRLQRRDQFGMPPVGSRLVDTQMVATINDWIRTPGVCN